MPPEAYLNEKRKELGWRISASEVSEADVFVFVVFFLVFLPALECSYFVLCCFPRARIEIENGTCFTTVVFHDTGQRSL